MLTNICCLILHYFLKLISLRWGSGKRFLHFAEETYKVCAAHDMYEVYSPEL